MSGRGKNPQLWDTPICSQLDMNECLSEQRMEHSSVERILAKHHHEDLVHAGHADAGALLKAMERYHELVQELEKVQREKEVYMRMCAQDEWHARRYTTREAHERLDQQGARLNESMHELGLEGENTVDPLAAAEAYRRRHHWNSIRLGEAQRARARLMEAAGRQRMEDEERAAMP